MSIWCSYFQSIILEFLSASEDLFSVPGGQKKLLGCSLLGGSVMKLTLWSSHRWCTTNISFAFHMNANAPFTIFTIMRKLKPRVRYFSPNENPLKIIKNVFISSQKLFILKVFKFLCWEEITKKVYSNKSNQL